MICQIPPVGYYTIAPISTITVEGDKPLSPWNLPFNNTSSVIVINKKTTDTDIGDEIVGELEYYIYIKDEENNGILKYHSKKEINSDIISVNGLLDNNKKDNSNNSTNISNKVPYKININNIKYNFYQECKGE